jgi:hypothetical protein
MSREPYLVFEKRGETPSGREIFQVSGAQARTRPQPF